MPSITYTLKIPSENLKCSHCGIQHVDENEWALRPHKTHSCAHCGELFEGSIHAVSHPMVQPAYAAKFSGYTRHRRIKPLYARLLAMILAAVPTLLGAWCLVNNQITAGWALAAIGALVSGVCGWVQARNNRL